MPGNRFTGSLRPCPGAAVINVYKLEKLPRGQRLRKAASVFAAAERQILSQNPPKPDELARLADIAVFLSRDGRLAPPAVKVLADAAAILTAGNTGAARRALNSVRHLLLGETGVTQADWDFTDGAGRLDPAKRKVFPGMFVYLDDIRSPFNVGAMFRSAESFGAQKIYVSPLCADPGHRRAERTAMGCVGVLPWERIDFSEVPPVPVFALETGGTGLARFDFPERGLLVAGSEELGVSPAALATADRSLGRVSIPCYGAKGSLNVSVAFGIVMQAWAARLAEEG